MFLKVLNRCIWFYWSSCLLFIRSMMYYYVYSNRKTDRLRRPWLGNQKALGHFFKLKVLFFPNLIMKIQFHSTNSQLSYWEMHANVDGKKDGVTRVERLDATLKSLVFLAQVKTLQTFSSFQRIAVFTPPYVFSLLSSLVSRWFWVELSWVEFLSLPHFNCCTTHIKRNPKWLFSFGPKRFFRKPNVRSRAVHESRNTSSQMTIPI